MSDFLDDLEKSQGDLEDMTWKIVDVFEKDADSFLIDWLNSIKLFLKKLPFEVVEDAMLQAVVRLPKRNQYTFRYFCGICWARIKENQLNEIINSEMKTKQ